MACPLPVLCEVLCIPGLPENTLALIETTLSAYSFFAGVAARLVLICAPASSSAASSHVHPRVVALFTSR
jgi:hypothetical protein